ncbi:MAG: HAD family hydrolase [Planctomycetes bacterium]|nr:HAD family hydrolase [Planctomycetota bacterium]
MNPAPDLVIFDVDGTLHDAFAWWTPVIRRGLEAFASQTGLSLDRPSVEFAESVVGMKDNGVWDPFLPDGEKHRWRELRAVVLPMELDELRSGSDYLFEGVRPLLAHLREIGVRTALASNCHSEYMTAMCEGQGLAEATDWQYCLDSEGVDSKTDMLRRAIEASDARRAVMIGDREPDQAAARDVGIPFLWRRNTRCELHDADAVWDGEPNQLLGQLGLPEIS